MKKLIITFLIIIFSFQTVFAAYGIQTKTSHCIANQTLPDPACSPGAVLTTDTKKVCVSGYTKTVRNVPLAERKQVFAEYGIPYSQSANYEVDHIISLELGGSNDIANLFPESYKIKEGARVKDVLENYLNKQVCSGVITIQQAQQEISSDWYKYYLLIPSATKKPAVTSTTVTASASPLVKKSSTGLCHAKGSRYYDQTTSYTPYASMSACVASGGRAD